MTRLHRVLGSSLVAPCAPAWMHMFAWAQQVLRRLHRLKIRWCFSCTTLSVAKYGVPLSASYLPGSELHLCVLRLPRQPSQSQQRFDLDGFCDFLGLFVYVQVYDIGELSLSDGSGSFVVNQVTSFGAYTLHIGQVHRPMMILPPFQPSSP